MSREIQFTQLQRGKAQVTEPFILIMWAHSGRDERLSCSEAVTFDGGNYLATGISVSNLVVGESAVVSVPATRQRVLEVQNGTYRNKVCKIYAIAGDLSGTPVFAAYEAVLALDGVIISSEFTGSVVRAQVLHRNLLPRMAPRDNISQWANHVPPAGTVLISGKQNTELEKSR